MFDVLARNAVPFLVFSAGIGGKHAYNYVHIATRQFATPKYVKGTCSIKCA